MERKNNAGQREPSAGGYRWILLFAAFCVMMIISIYQYSWFLFAYTLQEKLKWSLASIGLTFTVFTYTATFIQPFSGYVADSHGPRKAAVTAAFLTGLGFILASWASSPRQLYLSYGIGGIGVGILYGVSTACAIKWFPEKRGFATGLVVFGFGAGTALFNFFIQSSLETRGVRPTFWVIGLLMAITLIPLALLYKYPPTDRVELSSSNAGKAAFNFTPAEMVKTYQWLVIYFSFIVTVSIVLIFGAQMKMVAKEFNVPKRYVNLLLVLFPLSNGLSRVISGMLSDQIGRERTMRIFYSLLGVTIFCFVIYGHIPILFMITVVIAGLLGGSPFALYPATIGDYYGPKYATTNYGITYTAKAWAGLISGWLSGYLVMQFGSYKIPMVIVALGSLVAAAFSLPQLMKAPQKQLGLVAKVENR